jgi:hypothetical protein
MFYGWLNMGGKRPQPSLFLYENRRNLSSKSLNFSMDILPEYLRTTQALAEYLIQTTVTGHHLKNTMGRCR